MPHPMDLSHNLVAAPLDRPLRIRRIILPQALDRCAARGIRIGDEVRCLATSRRGVVLHTPEHGVLTLELALAVCVEFELASDGLRSASAA